MSTVQITPHTGRIRVEMGGYLLAESDAVLEVREQGHSPALYFPPGAVRLGRLKESATSTFCPRKGQAKYHSISVGTCIEEDGVWLYPEPIEAVAELAGYFAFRSDAVDAYDETGARLLGPAQCNDCNDAAL
jgi:uncharacterized protein (DUF427 family)